MNTSHARSGHTHLGNDTNHAQSLANFGPSCLGGPREQTHVPQRKPQ